MLLVTPEQNMHTPAQTKCYYANELKDDHMGGTCSSHSGRNVMGKRDSIQIDFNKRGAGVYRIRLLKLTVKVWCKHDK